MGPPVAPGEEGQAQGGLCSVSTGNGAVAATLTDRTEVLVPCL